MRRKKDLNKDKSTELIKKLKWFSENFISGFALGKIINNNIEQVIDCEFISVNKAFEIHTGKKKEELIGHKWSELFLNYKNSKFNWIDLVGTVALKNSKAKFSYYAEHAQKWFSVTISSPENGYFIILLDDTTKVKKSEIQLRLKEEEIERLNNEFRNQNQELAERNEILATLNEKHLKAIKELSDSILHAEKIHNQLLESETAARAIIDAASDLILLLNSDGTILDCNESLLKTLGLTKEKVKGKVIFNFFPPDISKSRKESVERVVASGEKEIIRDIGDSGYYETTISPCFDQNKKVTRIVIIARNISERFEAQKELFESEKKYRLLAENSEDVIWTYDVKVMRFSYISPSVTKLRGYTIEEAMAGLPEDTLISPYKESLYETIKKRIDAFEKGDQSLLVHTYQVEQVCKDGLIKPVEIVSKFITDENGKVVEILGVSRDISQRRDIECKLKKALEQAEESDRLKSAFLANMSHEIRTPMNGIIGFADLLNNPDIEPKKITKYAEIININGKHLLSIINDIIDISKIEAGQISVNESDVNINNFLDDLIAFFSSTNLRNPKVKISFNSKLQTINALVFTDEVKLKQILTNLITNALKFTEKGNVSLDCKVVKQEGKQFLLFIISDTGIGISKANQPVIFERFRQVDFTTERKYGGTGLGLPISKAYVELMGGKIWVDSDIGKGARFYFTIPLKRVNNASSIDDQFNEDSLVSSVDWANKLILIAEDEDTNFFFLSEILNQTGAKVIQAHNGNEAVNLCKQNKYIDLVLMDIKMPDLNGYEATRKIKEIRPGLPIIAQTAFAFSDDLQKALEAGCDDYIAKPILKEYLIEKLNHFFDSTIK
jgi:PAS domain S-box-containing protein